MNEIASVVSLRNILTAEEAATLARVGVNTILRELAAGRLKGVKTHGSRGHWRTTVKAVYEWIEGSCVDDIEC